MASTKTYNTGRVVGWSAYEEFLKQNPDIDPSVVTEQIWITATTYGVTRTVNLQTTGWSGTNILTKTVAVPGAVWGTIPIAGIHFDALSALADTATAASNKQKVMRAAENIFACYCSNSSGVKLANASQTGGYITFCAHPALINSGLTEIPLIIRGLGLEGLADGHAYLGPEGMVGGAGGSGDSNNQIMDHHLTNFTISSTLGTQGQWFDMKFGGGQKWISGLSFLSDPADTSDVSPDHYSIHGNSSSTVDITMTAPASSLTTSDITYTGYFSWEDLLNMLVLDRKAKLSFTLDKMDVGNPTYIDITQLFNNKVYNATSQQYDLYPSLMACELRIGDTKAYPVFSAWPGVTDSPSDSAYDGYYRVVLKLYPAPLGTTSKFEMLVLSYLKSDITLTSASSSNWVSSGFTWRGTVSDACYDYAVAHYAGLTGNKDQLTLLTKSIGSVSGFFQPSEAKTVLWDTVPEATSANLGPVNYLMRKSFDVTSNANSWQLSFTIKGTPMSGTDNDCLYGIDTSCSSTSTSATSALTTFVGYTVAADSYTWRAATTMDALIANFNPSHASFYTTFSGIYTTI